MMRYALTAAEIEARAEEAGLTMADVCRAAGIAITTFWRWKTGQTEPTLGIYLKLCAATEPPDKAA